MALEGRRPQKRKNSHNREWRAADRRPSERGAEAGRGCVPIPPAGTSSPKRRQQDTSGSFRKAGLRETPTCTAPGHCWTHLAGSKAWWPLFLRPLIARTPDGSPPAPRSHSRERKAAHTQVCECPQQADSSHRPMLVRGKSTWPPG